ncbi:hypothetical protein EDC04DRAFT_1435155 [Pisolithus marmoratus]|nr:hypothetical protein EDC04DRAFT_1435155 [Pisolithus marmoratus]
MHTSNTKAFTRILRYPIHMATQASCQCIPSSNVYENVSTRTWASSASRTTCHPCPALDCRSVRLHPPDSACHSPSLPSAYCVVAAWVPLTIHNPHAHQSTIYPISAHCWFWSVLLLWRHDRGTTDGVLSSAGKHFVVTCSLSQTSHRAPSDLATGDNAISACLRIDTAFHSHSPASSFLLWNTLMKKKKARGHEDYLVHIHIRKCKFVRNPNEVSDLASVIPHSSSLNHNCVPTCTLPYCSHHTPDRTVCFPVRLTARALRHLSSHPISH